MPSEPSPWDRRDFFKEKKHERNDTLAPVARWRDSYHGSRDFARGGIEESRRLPGPGKQGNYHLFPEESGYGCASSRTGERMVEDESCRPSGSLAEGRYSRRENKGSFKDWKGYHHQHHHSWEGAGDALVGGSFERHHDVSAQRSVDDLLTHSDIENSSWDQLDLKDRHDKAGSVDGLGTSHLYDKDDSLGSIAWKPLKWSRSVSLSSRGSGFSHSNSSKSTRAHSDELRIELPPGKSTPVRSPSADPAAGLTNSVQFEETCPRKKQRLGWGQGLAKYEKEKVEGPEESTGKNLLVQCSSNGKTVHNASTMNLPDRSPKMSGLLECASPTTPCSVAYSSSPGVEDKPFFKAANIDIDMNHFSDSPANGFQNCPEEMSVNVEHFELDPSYSMSSRLFELLQTVDACSEDSNFVRSTALHKLLLIKTDILKALEKTETDIDLFENELKSLESKSRANITFPATSESLLAETLPKPCKENPDSAAHFIVEKSVSCNAPTEAHAEIKDVDSVSLVTVKLLPMEKRASSSDIPKLNQCSTELDAADSTSGHGQSSASVVNGKVLADVCDDRGDTCVIVSSTDAYASSSISPHKEAACRSTTSILASNKQSAREATEVFDKLLRVDLSKFDIWGAANNILKRQSDLQIKEAVVMRKSFQRFKERVLTLKFRAFQHMWKEDMRLLSMRKNRAKSQKRFELSCRSSSSGSQKHRSSIRSRFTSPAGNLTLVPTTEIVDFTSKLLSDSQINPFRSTLKMPALILDEKERRHSRFITSNGLVEDPCAVEKEKITINPWMQEEKEIFMEMLATFGKDFAKIATFLSHKTTADCVEFYYKNHKSESFAKIKERLMLRKQGRCFSTNTYLVTSGKKWNREGNSASLDMLGVASVVAAHANDVGKTEHSYAGRSILGGYYECKMSQGNKWTVERTSSADIPGNESEAADALAGICGGLSSEAVSSCITSSIDHLEGFQESKAQKINYMISDQRFPPDLSQNIDEGDTCSDVSCGELDSVDWTDEEKSTFMMALQSYGRDFASISRCVGTKSGDQCKIFFSKARKCLGLDVMHPCPDNEGTPMSDANGGRSDTEDACVVEMDSAICSTQSCSKIDADPQVPLMNASVEGYGHGQNILPQIELDRSSGKDETGGSNLEEVDNIIEKCAPNDVQPGVKMDKTFNVGRKILVEEDQCDINPEVLRENGAAAGYDSLNSDLAVQLYQGSDLAVDTESKERGTDQAVIPADTVSREGQNVIGHCRSQVVVGLTQEAVEGNLEKEVKTESDSHQFPLPQSVSDKRRNAKSSSVTSHCSSSSGPVPDLKGKGKCTLPGAQVNVQPSFSFIPNHQHQMSSELLPCKQKSQIISWQQKENCPSEEVNSLLPDSSSIHHYEDRIHEAAQSTLNFEEFGNKQHKKFIGADFYQQYLLGHQSSNRVDQPLQILKGYPLCVLNKKEKNENTDTITEKPVLPQKISKDENSSTQAFRKDLHLQHEKCSGLKIPHSVSELSFLLKNHEQNDDLQRSSQSLDRQVRSSYQTEVQSRKTGDVKLFGQILSHLTPLQKESAPQENSEQSLSPKISKLFNLKCTQNKTDGASITARHESNNYLGMEDFPMTSYGFWDGNKIQTGLSSLPQSAALSSKHPTAISDYQSVCRIEQQPQASIATRTDRSLGRVSVFPTKDASSNGGLSEYQVYRSYQGMNVQPFSVEMKRQDVLPELEKRNGFETVLGYQQHGRGAVETNVVGGGILVGGGCTGVSDPVAAIKMHYATEKHFGGGGTSGGIVREEDSWRRGDIGR